MNLTIQSAGPVQVTLISRWAPIQGTITLPPGSSISIRGGRPVVPTRGRRASVVPTRGRRVSPLPTSDRRVPPLLARGRRASPEPEAALDRPLRGRRAPPETKTAEYHAEVALLNAEIDAYMRQHASSCLARIGCSARCTCADDHDGLVFVDASPRPGGAR